MTDTEAAAAADHEKRFLHEIERSLLARIQTLEADNRRLKSRWSMAILGMAILLGLTAALVIVSAKNGGLPGTVSDVVEGRQFLVRDKDGKVRGGWGMADDGSLRLTLQGPTNKAAVTLTVLKGGAPGLTFSDSTGRPRAVLGLLPDGTLSLTFADGAGTTRSALGVNPEGSATLVFADRTGATRAGLGVDSRGVGSLTVVDKQQLGPETEAAADSAAEDSSPPASPPAPTPTRPQSRRK